MIIGLDNGYGVQVNTEIIDVNEEILYDLIDDMREGLFSIELEFSFYVTTKERAKIETYYRFRCMPIVDGKLMSIGIGSINFINVYTQLEMKEKVKERWRKMDENIKRMDTLYDENRR